MTRNLKAEYDELCGKIARFSRFRELYERYLCYKVLDKTTGADKFVFAEKRAQENAEFLQNWQDKKAKILARVKKNCYKVKNGKISDLKQLKKGDRKLEELTELLNLENEFAGEFDLDEMFENLRAQRLKLEKELFESQSQPQ